MFKLKVFLVFFLPLALQAQDVLKVSRQAKLTYSKYDDAFFVIDDSAHYYTYSLKKAKWQKHGLHIVLKDSLNFVKFKERFYPLAVGKAHYLFVQDGCGMVYELKGDTMKRIDRSYDQKNQFGSALYTYNGQPYMFGGYGLFEVKNTHTYFEYSAKEWFQVNRHTKLCPQPRSTPYFIQQQKALYILGGVEKHFDSNKLFKDIWKFDHSTTTWELLGELNPEFIYRTRVRGFTQNKDYQIFHSGNKLTIIDILNNKYYSYVSNKYLPMLRLIPDARMHSILVASHATNDGDQAFLEVKKMEELLYGNPIEYYLYKPLSFFKQVPVVTYLWLSVLLNIAFFFLLFYLKRLTKTAWYKPKNPILKRKDFSDIEWQAIALIKQNDELELSALNYLFDEPGLSYETLKKRRESFVKALRIKLALITRRDVDQLLQESKHPLDKRMKIIRWNKELEINQEN
jgi:hypothetical protein